MKQRRSTSGYQSPPAYEHLAFNEGKRVLAALHRLGWRVKRQTGSHQTMFRDGYPDFVFACHEGDEIRPRMLARLAKHTGLKPGDL